ncbi:MAG: hypothetical protein GKR90_02165 [Pseudomonadales bacterium]|nr:hypothetical protein [Pseudomonadales bacterium]
MCTVLLCTCAVEDKLGNVRFHSEPYPAKLSEWNLFSFKDRLDFATGVVPYDLNMPLFSDYAQKLRTIYIPPGQSAKFDAEGPFEFPVGTIVSKTFFYFTDKDLVLLDAEWDGNPLNLAANDIRLIETRLLVRQEHGWDTLPYIWRGDDASLTISGDLLALKTNNATEVTAKIADSSNRGKESGTEELHYLIPSKNQCASCHATNHSTGLNQPIGLKARYLNRAGPSNNENQLVSMKKKVV